MAEEKKYILAIDVGTTCVKAFIYDESLTVISTASQRVKIYEPQPGWSEIMPDDLWHSVVEAITEAIKKSGKEAKDLASVGVCVQRNSFITWDAKSAQPLHNFITWKDKRCQSLCDQWNAAKSFRLFKGVARGLCLLTRNAPQWRTVVNFQFLPAHTSMRLLWALNNIEPLQKAVAQGRARFGTVETYLLWRLTGGRTWCAEPSCASTSGLYDCYSTLNWNKGLLTLLGIPVSILPPVYDSVFTDFGSIDPNIFGASIPIKAVMADQSAALVGECCFKKDATKLTLGTGAFLNVVTGINNPIAVTILVFPIVVFKNAAEAIFSSEIYLPQASYIGNIIDTLVADGYISDLKKLDETAESVHDTAGVKFIPNQGDGKVGHRIEGRTESTKPAHIVRAALLSIGDIVIQLGKQLEKDAPGVRVFGKADDDLPPVRVDGGVTRSNFVCQIVANALQRKVQRLNDVEASIRGAAMLAGYGASIFPSIAHMESLVLSSSNDEKNTKYTFFAPNN